MILAISLFFLSSKNDSAKNSINIFTFEPIIVPKHEKRLPIFNDQIISMYSFGMSDKDIKSHLEEIYNVEVSPDLISLGTNAVLEEVSPPLVVRNGRTVIWKNHMR
jgi:hypothetical protein